MKKQAKKLKLAKETVRTLESGIEHARGGSYAPCYPSLDRASCGEACQDEFATMQQC
jgi:hypothetical protein